MSWGFLGCQKKYGKISGRYDWTCLKLVNILWFLHQEFQVPKMEESSNLYKLYGYGLWIREFPHPQNSRFNKVQETLHFRFLKFFFWILVVTTQIIHIHHVYLDPSRGGTVITWNLWRFLSFPNSCASMERKDWQWFQNRRDSQENKLGIPILRSVGPDDRF